MIDEEKIQQLKNDIHTKERKEAREASNTLLDLGPDLCAEQHDNLFSFYMELLENDSYDKRCIAAYALAIIERKEAVIPLFNAIFTRERTNYNGTFVYALTGLDCSEHLKDVFEILFYQGFEAKNHAYYILCEQEFILDREELLEIRDKWEDLKKNPEKGVCFESTKEMIEDAVEGYLMYLDKLN